MNQGIRLVIKSVVIGAIVAIPVLVFIMILESGSYTGDDGICPIYKVDRQTTSEGNRICDSVRERGVRDGEVTGGGFTCWDGVYYQTNYRCITKTLGFYESESGLIAYTWLFLAETYGMLAGGIIGITRLMKLKKKVIS